jgi:YD repeat-containing protein
MVFDPDHGNPSPGFRLGFPEIEGHPETGAPITAHGRPTYLLLMPSGRRVALGQIAGSPNVYESGDSSYMRLTVESGGQMTLRTADGTTLRFAWFAQPTGAPAYRCTEVKDTNGNYLTITYTANGRLNTVTDTLGRVFGFSYYDNFHVSDITQTWNGQTHGWAHFDYMAIGFSTNFGSLAVNGPANGTGHTMLYMVTTNDGTHWDFRYNSYGMVEVIHRWAADWAHRSTHSSVYNNVYTSQLSDCPRLHLRQFWVADWNPGEVTHFFDTNPDRVDPVTGLRWGSTTAPDGTITKEFFGASGWQQGLKKRTETWSGGALKKWAEAAWTQDNESLNYPANPRLTEANVYDDTDGNGSPDHHRRTTVAYTPLLLNGVAVCTLPSEVTEYKENATTPYRTTRTEYVDDAAYLSRRLLGLPKFRYLHEGLTNGPLAAKVGYVYDGDALDALPDGVTAVQHDAAWGGAERGNLTRVRRYDVNSPASYVETKTTYNVTGSPTEILDPRQHRQTVGYGDSFSDNLNRNTFAYPTSVTAHDVDANNSPVGFTTSAQYNYDFGAVTRTQDPKGAVVVRSYDWAGRVSRVATQVKDANNVYQDYAYTRYVYSNSHNYVQSFSTVNDLSPANEFYSITVFDGHDRVRAVVSDHYTAMVNGSPENRYSSTYNVYDALGRLTQQSNPTEINGGWSPAGDDAAGYVWSQQAYDWKGRPTVTTNQDGTTKQALYEGCGCAGGEVVTLIDEAGRKQSVTHDFLGRVTKSEVLKQNGGNWDVYSTTKTTYNVRDQVTEVREIEGTNSTARVTTSGYDGHGRLQQRKVPIADGPTVYDYWPDDTVKSVTDPRNVTASYAYNARDLVTGITFNLNGSTTVEPVDPISFTYDEAGNRLTMADTTGTMTYHYDALSRIEWERKHVNDLNQDYTISYQYNRAGQVTQVTDPFNDTIYYSRDKAGRLANITGSNFGGVTQYTSTQADSQVKYRAWGGVKQLTYGNGLKTNLEYDTRLRVSGYELNGRNPLYGPSLAARTEHEYYGDGSLYFSKDVLDARFDRAFAYDHARRMKEAYSGLEARTFANKARPDGNDLQGPYRQSHGYDIWHNMVSSTGRAWSQTTSYSPVYNPTTGRRQGVSYDAVGNVVGDNTIETSTAYKYSAQNLNVEIYSQTVVNETSSGNLTQQEYDGDGRAVKRYTQKIVPGQYYIPHVTYHLYSTPLGGMLLTEVDSENGKRKGYVFGEGVLIAEQNRVVQTSENKWVYWQHHNPVTGGAGYSQTVGDYNHQVESDSLGTNVGLSQPPSAPPAPSGGSYGRGIMLRSQGNCWIDGVAADCYMAHSLVQSGAAVVAPASGVHYSRAMRAWVEYRAYADGREGWMPPGASYRGNGYWSWVVKSGRYGSDGEYDVKLGQQDPVQLPPSLGPIRIPPLQPPQLQARTTRDLIYSIYGDAALMKKINDCLKKLLGANFSKVGGQALDNAPQLDTRLSALGIAKKFGMGYTDKGTGKFVYTPPYATGVGHIGGAYGTIYIGSEFFNDTTQWGHSRPDLPGRTPLQNAYVHELGNLASYRASGGTTYGLFGVKGASDEDSGYQLQKCVFGN